nr:integrase, catalytic region, zinc finger, CCHC-type, peptidase aspartic, catalytic [Tanacetum cinerariifolium]
GTNPQGRGATGYGGVQNRVGNANPGQARQDKCYNRNGIGVALDEEQLLFLAGGQDNAIDEDVDEQPVQDLALNMDNVFQADDCEAFDSDITMSKMQLNSKFVNNMLPEWGRFSIAVNLNRGLRDSNYDQLYAYLKQHEKHANENQMMLDGFTQHTVDPLALMSNVSHQPYYSQSSLTPPSTYGTNPQGRGATGYGGVQNRVGNANPGQARQDKCYNRNGIGVALDEEQLLFLAGGQDNAIDEDVDARVNSTVLALGKYAIDVEPIPPHLRNNRVNRCIDASGSQPRSNTKKNKISPTKGVNKMQVEEQPRTNKSHLRTTNRVDFSSRSKTTLSKFGNLSKLGKYGNPQAKYLPVLVINGDLQVVQIILWYLDSGCSKHMTRDRSWLMNFVKKFIGTARFGNDHFSAIMGYGDYVIGDSAISKVYYMEGLRHKLFFVRQFCDFDLEVAFRKHSCYVRDTNEDIQCAGFDTRPPMLDRIDFDSWQQRIRLYCWGKENEVNILKSIDEGPFQMETVREPIAEGTKREPHLGPERPRVYSNLSPEERDRYNADIRATNILL